MSMIHTCKTLASLKSFLNSSFHTKEAKEAGKSRTLYFDYLTLLGGNLSDIMAEFADYAKKHDYHAFETPSYCIGHCRYRQERLGWQYTMKPLRNGDTYIKLTAVKPELGKSYKKRLAK